MRVAFVVVVLAALACTAQGFGGFSGGSNYTWNETTAYTMAQFASAVYCEKDELIPWTCAVCNGQTDGFEVTAYFEDPVTGLEALAGVDVGDRSIVVSFEGSHNIQNWITNLKIKKADWTELPGAPKDALVHRGFLSAYQAVQKIVEEDVTDLVDKYPDFDVYVTGHSLGGALAALGALDLTVLRPGIPAHVYTFGSPRVGNDAFQLYFQSKIVNSIRVVHEKDIVPHLPFRFLAYHHVPREVWEHDGKYKVCNGSGEDASCSDSVLLPNTSDHAHYMGLKMSGCQERPPTQSL